MGKRILIVVIVLALLAGAGFVALELLDRRHEPGPPLHIVMVRELDQVEELGGWNPAGPDAKPEDAEDAAAELRRIAADVEEIIRPVNVRAMSEQAKEAMESFDSLPPLAEVGLRLRAAAPEGGDLLFEGTWAELPAETPERPRRLVVHPVLMKATGRIERITVAIRGGQAE